MSNCDAALDSERIEKPENVIPHQFERVPAWVGAAPVPATVERVHAVPGSEAGNDRLPTSAVVTEAVQEHHRRSGRLAGNADRDVHVANSHYVCFVGSLAHPATLRPRSNRRGRPVDLTSSPCKVIRMTTAKYRVSGRGHMALPAEARRRWNLIEG